MGRDGPPDRYEPLPSLPELPRWLWRRASRSLRVASVLVGLAIVAAAVVLLPRIGADTREAERRDARERAAQQQRLARALAQEQRPVLKRAAPARDLEARQAMLGTIAAAILADSRERVKKGTLRGPIRRVDCEPFPNGSDPADRDPTRRRGRYSCVAVTAAFKGGVIGHQYRIKADFQTGRYGFCKITGRAGPERDRPVTIPAACGGDDYGDG